MIDLIKQLLYLGVDKIVDDLEKLSANEKQKEKEINDVVEETKINFPPVEIDVIKPFEIKEVKSGEIDIKQKKKKKKRGFTKEQKQIRSEYMKEYREKNKEKIRQQQRENYRKNRERYLEYARRANEKRKQKKLEEKQEAEMRELERRYARAGNFYS